MVCLDKTFCRDSDKCAGVDCGLRYTNEHEKARISISACKPISFASFADTCEHFSPALENKGNLRKIYK